MGISYIMVKQIKGSRNLWFINNQHEIKRVLATLGVLMKTGKLLEQLSGRCLVTEFQNKGEGLLPTYNNYYKK